MKTRDMVISGDSRHMASLSDSSVHLIVTSPPYWQFKDYDSADQIGFDNLGAITWQKVTTCNL